MKKTILGMLIIINASLALAKTPKNGILYTHKDSLFSVNFRFRVQSRAWYNTVSNNDFSASSIEARVRRLRLRLEGFAVTPKLTYKIQLSFSRGDMDWNVRDNGINNNSPNVVRDAVVYYQFTKFFNIGFGQTKLPGNRERVFSSGSLQFIDRSNANATFNIDRDFGIFPTYQNHLGNFVYILKGAVSSGEGRNSNSSDAGLAYTSRVELLPFGLFTNGGDYFGGDLEREETPKLSLAVGYSHHENSVRQASTLGLDLYQPRNMNYWFLDYIFKYKGFCSMGEYMSRNTSNPITVDPKGATRRIYEGEGANVSVSYCFKNNYEIAARYTYITPTAVLKKLDHRIENYTIGINKYLNHHTTKIQLNAGYQNAMGISGAADKENLFVAFQIELGI